MLPHTVASSMSGWGSGEAQYASHVHLLVGGFR